MLRLYDGLGPNPRLVRMFIAEKKLELDPPATDGHGPAQRAELHRDRAADAGAGAGHEGDAVALGVEWAHGFSFAGSAHQSTRLGRRHSRDRRRMR
jgi:hypothetical protein